MRFVFLVASSANSCALSCCHTGRVIVLTYLHMHILLTCGAHTARGLHLRLDLRGPVLTFLYGICLVCQSCNLLTSSLGILTLVDCCGRLPHGCLHLFITRKLTHSSLRSLSQSSPVITLTSVNSCAVVCLASTWSIWCHCFVRLRCQVS